MKFVKVIPALFVAFALMSSPIAKADPAAAQKVEAAKTTGVADAGKTVGDDAKKDCEHCKKGHQCKDCKEGKECKECKGKKHCEHCDKDKKGCEHCKVEGSSDHHVDHQHAKHPHDTHEEVKK